MAIATNNGVPIILGGKIVAACSCCGTWACYSPDAGACCAEANCRVVQQCDCDTENGEVFWGVGTTCDPNPCIGRCCQENGNCEDGLTAAECEERDGYGFAGGTTCVSNPCPIPCCTEESRVPSFVSLRVVAGSVSRTDQPGRAIGPYSAESIDEIWWPALSSAMESFYVRAPISRRFNGAVPVFPPQFSIFGCSDPIAGGWIYYLGARSFIGCGGGDSLYFGFARAFDDGGGSSPAPSTVQDITIDGAVIPLIQCINQDTEMQFNQFPVSLSPRGFGETTACGRRVANPIFTQNQSQLSATVDLRLTLHYEPPNPLP